MGTAEALTLALERPSAAPALLARGYNQGVVEIAGTPPIHYVFGGFPDLRRLHRVVPRRCSAPSCRTMRADRGGRGGAAGLPTA